MVVCTRVQARVRWIAGAREGWKGPRELAGREHARARSQEATSWQPAAVAMPSTQAMTGRRSPQMPRRAHTL